MVAPLVPAASFALFSPCPTDVNQPMENLLSTPSLLNFPNEFDSSTVSSPPEDLTETEDETNDDEDDFLAGLARRLALSAQRLSSHSFVTGNSELKPQVTKTQSGLASPNGPFSQAPSPPTSPFPEEESLKVLSAAAGEVAKIKMADFDSKSSSRPNPNSVIPFPQNSAFCDNYYWLYQPQYHQSQIRFQSTLKQSPRRVQIAWFPSHSPVRGVYRSPNAVKSPSAGTGVFLPRKYSSPIDSKKKSGGGGVKFPTKVVHQKNPKIEELSGRCKPNSKACLSTGRKKNDFVVGGCLKQEKPLPKEWIY